MLVVPTLTLEVFDRRSQLLQKLLLTISDTI